MRKREESRGIHEIDFSPPALRTGALDEGVGLFHRSRTMAQYFNGDSFIFRLFPPPTQFNYFMKEVISLSFFQLFISHFSFLISHFSFLISHFSTLFLNLFLLYYLCSLLPLFPPCFIFCLPFLLSPPSLFLFF